VMLSLSLLFMFSQNRKERKINIFYDVWLFVLFVWLIKKLLAQSLGDQNVKHNRTAVVNKKAYLTNWFKSLLYVLDSLLNLSGKIISTSW
jgi:hypothetical protein